MGSWPPPGAPRHPGAQVPPPLQPAAAGPPHPPGGPPPGSDGFTGPGRSGTAGDGNRRGALIAGLIGLLTVALVVVLAVVVLPGGKAGTDASTRDTGGSATTRPTTTRPSTSTTRHDASSSTTSRTGSRATAGALEGMQGTNPLADPPAAFVQRVQDLAGRTGYGPLQSTAYASETYDAVIVIALAVEQARTDGTAFAAEVNGITRGGELCADFAACRAIIARGGDPDYEGVSGPLTFNGAGEPMLASYATYTFGADNRIDPALTTFRSVEAPAPFDVAQQDPVGDRQGDGVLQLGSLLPQTGALAFLGPAMIVAVELAVADVNAAGGVLGRPIVLNTGDSGDLATDAAARTADRLLSENVDAIVGAASSGVTLTVIDRVVGAGVVLFSPSNTSRTLSTYTDKGLYFRTAPSDALQAVAIADLVTADGHGAVAILRIDDDYGLDLGEDLTIALEERGVEIVASETYPADEDDFGPLVAEVVASRPDAVVILGFNETSRLLRTMVDAGIGPRDVAVYGCDGNTGDALGADFDAGL